DYHYWVSQFPRILSRLVANVRDEETRSFLTQILFQELGEGIATQRHAVLLRDLLKRLGVSRHDLDSAPRFDETAHLVSGMERLYGHSSLPRALGAQYALEHQAVP